MCCLFITVRERTRQEHIPCVRSEWISPARTGSQRRGRELHCLWKLREAVPLRSSGDRADGEDQGASFALNHVVFFSF